MNRRIFCVRKFKFPSGLTLSCYLARAGYRVAIFEQALFPRHQIGESLLPFSRQIFKEIGFEEKLHQGAFVKKHGACFHSERTNSERVFSFKDSLNPVYDYIYHVPREQFDVLLLDHAKECGVQVFQPCKIEKIEKTSTHVIINEKYTTHLFVQASGIFHSHQHPENYIQNNTNDNKTALYSYFKTNLNDISQKSSANEHYRAGDILINLFYEDKELCWSWAIPLSNHLMSVGYVLPSQSFKKYRDNNISYSEIGKSLLNKNPRLKKLLSDENPLEAFRLKFNFQRVSKNIVFDREIYIGDTAGFIDPVFSSGVHLGLNSAKIAFEVIKNCGNNSNYSINNLRDYEIQYKNLFWIYYKFVKTFYQKNIVEKFFLEVSPDRLDNEIAKCFTSILSGDVVTPNKIIDGLNHTRLNINPDVTNVFIQ